ncbi:MAG: hypothetical protein NUV83_02095 [Candidatus Wolfebacteria bacterium]|nr:hypothetical protein [Candidatus Wolfebacteria bacterium]
MNFNKYHNLKGQALIEILLGMVIGIIIIGGIAGILTITLKGDFNTKNTQLAASFAQDLVDKTKSVSESNWNYIYGLNKGGSSPYYIYYNTSTFVAEIKSGIETVTSIDGKNFNRYFYVENVNRNYCGTGDISTSSATGACLIWPPFLTYVSEDPSTQKITTFIKWDSDTRSIKEVQYLMRNLNNVFSQTEWQGGAGQENFPISGSSTLVNDKFSASTNTNFSSAGSITMSTTTSPANLTSSVFDTFIASGSAINSIVWKGLQLPNTSVSFQIASSNNSGGPWNYLGPDNTSGSYYVPNQNTSISVNPINHMNQRYFRYEIFLQTTVSQSPRVDDVIINWSL